jgi:GGDEF domain-containing protein
MTVAAAADTIAVSLMPNSMVEHIRSVSMPRRLAIASLVGYAAVFALILAYGRPGLGLGQLFYVPVVLAALASGPLVGGLAGVAAIFLYELALLLNGTITMHDIDAANTPIRLVSYVLAGVTVGYFATQGRRMLAESLHVLEDLLILSRRDLITASLSSEGLETATNQRLAAGRPFALLVGEIVGRRRNDDELRQTARLLAAEIRHGDQLARIGPNRFAILTSSMTPSAAREESEALERSLHGAGHAISFGWAVYPSEGKEAFELFGAAVDRLQARRIVRGEWEPTAASAELVDELPVARLANE